MLDWTGGIYQVGSCSSWDIHQGTVYMHRQGTVYMRGPPASQLCDRWAWDHRLSLREKSAFALILHLQRPGCSNWSLTSGPLIQSSDNFFYICVLMAGLWTRLLRLHFLCLHNFESVWPSSTWSPVQIPSQAQLKLCSSLVHKSVTNVCFDV